MRAFFFHVAGCVLALCSLGGARTAHAEAATLLRAEAGLSSIHGGAAGFGASTGLGFQLGETPLLFDIGLTGGIAKTGFIALEPSLELQLCMHCGVSVFAGGGAGVMLEGYSGSPNIPYFARAGLQIDLSEQTRLRIGARVGAHLYTGDEGSGPGPHLFSVGIEHAL